MITFFLSITLSEITLNNCLTVSLLLRYFHRPEHLRSCLQANPPTTSPGAVHGQSALTGHPMQQQQVQQQQVQQGVPIQTSMCLTATTMADGSQNIRTSAPTATMVSYI